MTTTASVFRNELARFPKSGSPGRLSIVAYRAWKPGFRLLLGRVCLLALLGMPFPTTNGLGRPPADGAPAPLVVCSQVSRGHCSVPRRPKAPNIPAIPATANMRRDSQDAVFPTTASTVSARAPWKSGLFQELQWGSDDAGGNSLPSPRGGNQVIYALRPRLRPRNGRVLQVLSVRRVSDPGPNKQDIRSLSDQGALHDRWLADNIKEPYEITVVEGSGSGEYLERAEYLRLIELVESDQYDLVITEDLGRIVRRIHAHLFCELCAEHHTRLVAINDNVDMAIKGWQDQSIFSAWDHERSNRDTSDRIKRTHCARFLQGGTLALPPFGYRKKPGAKSDDDLERVQEADPIYREWFRRLDEEAALYSEIGDWLNDSGVDTGPYCRNKKWDGRMVCRVTHNWILKGVRFRNKQKTERIGSGKYKSQKADPSELLIRRVPHLAFFDEAYYDRVVAKADARNAKYRRNNKNGPDPCLNRPKKRSRFPGQSIFCGVCGRLYVFGGHGQTDHLMCQGAREYICWNGITVDGSLGAQKICAACFVQIKTLEGFDPAFMEMVNEEARMIDASRDSRHRQVNADLDRVNRELANLMRFIRSGDDSPAVRAELRRIDEEQVRLEGEKLQIERTPSQTIVVPPVEEVKGIALDVFKDLAIDSFPFAKRLRELTWPIVVYPFKLCDGGHIVLRAKFRLQLANLLPDKGLQEVLQRPLERTLGVDLFDPPQRVEYREKILALRETNSEREVAKALRITVTAAQRAAALDRLMQQQGLSDPYVRLTEPPADYPKLRRHLHRRYHFALLPGFPAEW